MCSRVTASGSGSWSCQRLLGSCRCWSAPIVASLLKAPRQHRLDAVNLDGDSVGRQTGDVADARDVEVFEIEQRQLPIDRLQLLDQPQQSLPGVTLERVAF